MIKQAGFTLVELMIAVAMIGILSAIAIPVMSPMWKNARYKEATRNITSALRDARSRAISQNLEHRVSFDLVNETYWLEQGNESSGSTTWPTIRSFGLPEGVTLAADAWGGSCAVTTGTHYIEFNPNGTSETDITTSPDTFVCVLDASGARKYATGLSSNSTGRVRVQKRNSSDSAWTD